MLVLRQFRAGAVKDVTSAQTNSIRGFSLASSLLALIVHAYTHIFTFGLSHFITLSVWYCNIVYIDDQSSRFLVIWHELSPGESG